MKLRTVALAAGGIAAAYGAERVLVGRARGRIGPGVAERFAPPADAVHHEVPVSDGGMLHIVERGAGRPLVLLHGITLSAVTWHYQLLDLADRFRVLAVDHRGHGSSKPGDAEWNLSRLALDVHELLEHLDLRDAIVVGHSMGGMVALSYALDHPDSLRRRVIGLGLMSTAATPVHRLAAWRALSDVVTPSLKRGIALGDRVSGGLFPASDFSYLVFRMGMGKGASPEHVELNRLMTASTPVSVWGELLSGVGGFDVHDRLHEIDTPAMVLVGTRDVLTPPSAARRMVAGLPHARPLEAFPGAGHMLMLERRREVNECLLRFAGSLS